MCKGFEFVNKYINYKHMHLCTKKFLPLKRLWRFLLRSLRNGRPLSHNLPRSTHSKIRGSSCHPRSQDWRLWRWQRAWFHQHLWIYFIFTASDRQLTFLGLRHIFVFLYRFSDSRRQNKLHSSRFVRDNEVHTVRQRCVVIWATVIVESGRIFNCCFCCQFT